MRQQASAHQRTSNMWRIPARDDSPRQTRLFARRNTERTGEPSGRTGPWRGAAGAAEITVCLRPAAGTGDRSSGRTIARADARKHQESKEFTRSSGAVAANGSAEPGELLERAASRPPAQDRCRRPRERPPRAGRAGAGEGGKRVRQGLAPLGEHRPDHRLETPLVVDRDRRRPERQLNDRRVDLRGRPERAGRQASARAARRHAAARKIDRTP